MNDVERQLKDEESVKKIDIDYMTSGYEYKGK
jgi:hypothetical protein